MTASQILVVVYVALVLAIGLSGRFRQSAETFALDDRKVGTVRLAAAIFATLVTESLIFFAVAVTVRFGSLGAFAAVAGGVTGLLLLAAAATGVHNGARDRGFVSVAQLCADRWGPAAGGLARTCVLAFLAWIVILQINLNSKLLAEILGWSPALTTWVVVCVVAAYLALGGFRAVVRTDLFQSLVLVTMLVVPFVIRPRPDVSQALDTSRLKSDTAFIFVMSLAMTIVRPELWQRIFSARSAAVARRALHVSALAYLGFCLLVLYYALAVAQGDPGAGSMQAFVAGYRAVLPPAFAAVFPVILLAAMMSSLDSAVFAFAVDVTARAGARRVTWTRLSVAGLLVACGAASLTVFDALNFAYKLDGCMALLATPLIIGQFVELRVRDVGIALGIGAAAYVAIIVSGRLQQHPAEAVVGCIAAGLSLACLLARRRPES